VDLERNADELYGLPLAEFTPTRDALAAEARREGDKGLAEAVKKLKKPTVAAWLADQLARHRSDDVARLLDVGAALRAAQAELAGEEMRNLSQQRQQLVRSLSDEAVALAASSGERVTQPARQELEATLEAAVSSKELSDALRRGRLTSSLHYSGLGLGDVAPSAAAPRPSPSRAPAARAAGKTPRDDADLARAAEAAVAAAREVAERAERDLLDAGADVERSEERLATVRSEATQLRDRLDELRRDEQKAVRDLRESIWRREKAEAAVKKAQASIDRLG
jgi:hypothetical protein